MDDLEMERVRKLLQDLTRDKNTLYVFCVNHIKDFLLTGGFCHALLKKKGKQSCVLICGERFTNCGLNFDAVAEIQGLSQKDLDSILGYCVETGEYEGDNYIYSAPFGKIKGSDGKYHYRYNRGFSFLNRIKVNALNLPVDTKLLPPLIDPITDEQKHRLHETYILDKERTIILVPYASIMKSLEETFWAQMVADLKQKNSEYVFYTNVATPAEEVIPGTEPIVMTFPELMSIAENVNCFIGLRCGLFDLLARTNVRLLCINKNTDWWNFDLNLNHHHTNGRAFYIGIREQAKIQTFMEENYISSLAELPLYNHVKGTDIFFDMDSLRKAVVDSVDVVENSTEDEMVVDCLESARKLLQDLTRDKNTLYVFCVNHIGDFLITGGLCHALLKKKGKQSCVLICGERFINYGLNFVDVAEIQGLSQKDLKSILEYCTETGEYEGDNYIYSAPFSKIKGSDGKYHYRYNRGFSFLNRIKVNALNLPVDTKLLPPLIDPVTDEQKHRLHETYVLDKKRTIILVPYATVMKSLEESFWSDMVADLKQKNSEYVFYTNVATPAEEVIPGTEPIVMTFPELMSIAENVNCFIGLRCGLFDLLARTNTRLLCIQNGSIRWWWAFDLNLNYHHTNNRMFYLVDISYHSIVQNFEPNNVNFIDNLLIYDHVERRNVAFDEESLLKKIVDSVD